MALHEELMVAGFQAVVDKHGAEIKELFDLEIQVPSRTRLDIKTFSATVTVINDSASQHIDGFSSDFTV